MAEMPAEDFVPISHGHDLSAFDCGESALNNYLRKHAFANNQSNSARTYVALRADVVAGFYSLSAGSVDRTAVPPRIAKGLGGYPLPVVVLARLAVDRSFQGQGLGKRLLSNALLRCSQAADIIGCRAVLVHAKNAGAQAFYRKFGFESCPLDELLLTMLMKDIKASLP